MAEQEVAEKAQPGAATPAVATPTPAASVVAKPSAEIPAQEPAKETPKPQTPQEKVEFFKARVEKKQKESALAQELEESKRKVAEYERQLQERQQPTPAPSTTSSFFDDPDAWAKGVEERARQAVLSELQAKEKASEHRASAENATKWLLTQSHIQEDSTFANAVAEQIQNNYMDIAAVNPNAAAKLAYFDVCEAKGVAPSASVSGAGMSSSGVRPSAQPMGAAKVFQAGEVSPYLMELASSQDPAQREEFKRRVAEVETARREGRIKN